MTSPSRKRPFNATLPGNTLPVLPSTPRPKSQPRKCESVKRRRPESLFLTPCNPVPTTLQFPQDLFSQTELQTPPEESPYRTPRKPTPSKSDTLMELLSPIGGRYTIVCTLSLLKTI